LVLEESLYIGNTEIHKRIVPAFAPVMKHSWLYEDGLWRCYRNGVPRTGWYCYDGIDYYLKEDGSVTTGWANINGEDRFFSDTGAMRTGWLRTDAGVYYMLFNGAMTIGERVIDGAIYTFDEAGLLITE
jgi:glucan-binding YG repeat protein